MKKIIPFFLFIFCCSHTPIKNNETKKTEIIFNIKKITSQWYMCGDVPARAGENGITKQKKCDTGDSQFFGGILSTSFKSKKLCEGLLNAIDDSGRPWRSAEHKGHNQLNSYSRDQSLGMALYVLSCNDTKQKHDLHISFLQKNDFRFCPEIEDTDGRCIASPAIMQAHGLVRKLKSWEVPKEMEQTALERYIDEQLLLKTVDKMSPTDLHLAAVRMYLLVLTNNMTENYKKVTEKIFLKEKQNLFFRFLILKTHGENAHGETVEKLSLDLNRSIDNWEPPEGDSWYTFIGGGTAPAMGHEFVFLACALNADGCNE